jgi:hypothetical protein
VSRRLQRVAQTLKQLGGWKTLAMIARYSHLSPGHLAAAVERLVPGVTVQPTHAQEFGRNPSPPTATSASASCTGAPVNATKHRSTTPPPSRCTARWTCGSGWSRRRRR